MPRLKLSWKERTPWLHQPRPNPWIQWISPHTLAPCPCPFPGAPRSPAPCCPLLIPRPPKSSLLHQSIPFGTCTSPRQDSPIPGLVSAFLHPLPPLAIVDVFLSRCFLFFSPPRCVSSNRHSLNNRYFFFSFRGIEEFGEYSSYFASLVSDFILLIHHNQTKSIKLDFALSLPEPVTSTASTVWTRASIKIG